MSEREAIPFNELDEATEAEFEDMFSSMQEDEPEGFHITNDTIADWAVRKIQEEREENKRIHAIAQDQMDGIAAKLHAADSRLTSRTSFLLGRLNEYFNNVPHKETKTTAKYQLLSGALVYKKPAVKIVKVDDDLLVAWLKNSGNAQFVKTVETPAWGELKKRLDTVGADVVDTETGEIVEGAVVETTEGSFDIK
jgi:phage host-nuclease inhibitor protein Gam